MWAYRLANLVLLSRIKNTELSNRKFDEKRKKYFKSSVNIFPNVVKVMQYADRTPQVLEERQEQLLDVLIQRFKYPHSRRVRGSTWRAACPTCSGAGDNPGAATTQPRTTRSRL